jgi:hypothetical protein
VVSLVLLVLMHAPLCLNDTSMLASMIYLWVTKRGLSLLVTTSLSTDVFTFCSSAFLLHVALLVASLNVLYRWFPCSYVPFALLFAL